MYRAEITPFSNSIAFFNPECKKRNVCQCFFCQYRLMTVRSALSKGPFPEGAPAPLFVEDVDDDRLQGGGFHYALCCAPRPLIQEEEEEVEKCFQTW